MTSKEIAVQRYIQAHQPEIEFKQELMSAVVGNPDLITDRGMREAGLDSALTLNKLALFQRGVLPQGINEANTGVSNAPSRRNVYRFVETVHTLSTPFNGTLMQEGASYEVGRNGK